MPSAPLRILVPIEFPEHENALLRFAASLAATRKGTLHLTHIVTPTSSTSNQAQSFLENAAALARQQGVEAFAHLYASPTVTQGIKEVVKRWQCNMMLMGWYHNIEREVILSAPNRALTKELGIDTLIFKERDTYPVRRFLVPTSGGSHAFMGIQIAQELATHTGASLEILRIARDPRCRPDDPRLQRYCAQLYENTRLQMDLLEIEAPITVQPAVELIPAITSKVNPGDMVILGASNDWRQEEHLAGSIPDEIANKVPVSVLMVRSAAPDPHLLGNIFWEKNIRLDLSPANKWDAIAQMVDILIEERQVPQSQRDNILNAALEREHKSSTAMGHATAIPHAPIPNLPAVIGAVGICPSGLDFDAQDGGAVRFIFLLLTPQQNYRSYIPVLAQIAGLMRAPDTQQALLDSQTPSEVAAHFRNYKAL